MGQREWSMPRAVIVAVKITTRESSGNGCKVKVDNIEVPVKGKEKRYCRCTVGMPFRLLSDEWLHTPL